MTLDTLSPGQSAVIRAVGGEDALRRHLLAMGVIPGERVTLVKFAPLGDPMELRLHGYSLALRLADAARITVAPAAPDVPACRQQPLSGEGSVSSRSGAPLPDDAALTFALAGNPNCGKTTLFNQLTGMNQRVGNFPGVTVERKDGVIRGRAHTLITDLPGIYSLSPYSAEERITRSFLLRDRPHCIINIADVTSLSRGLSLTLELMELGIPMVLALNMMDELAASGGSVRVRAMEALLGIPVVPISAAKDEGLGELIDRAIHAARDQERPCRPYRIDAPDTDDRAAQQRFAFIRRVCEETVRLPQASRAYLRSQRIDRILTGRYTAIPAFIAIMALIFFLTFSVVGAALSKRLEGAIGLLTERADGLLAARHVSPTLRSLVFDGIFGGVGSVVSFLPFIMALFFFLSLLEDSGYMARVAFVMDKPLRRLGLCGRSIVPLLMGFGCTVPGVMAARTLSSERDRRMTILLTPFMSCSAKLPIYALLAALFFPEHIGAVMASLYALGILFGIAAALLLRQTAFAGDPVPFVMELPSYRLPGLGNVMRLLADKAQDFLLRAFTVIFVATIAIWCLRTFDLRMRVTQSPENSLLAAAAGLLAPLFTPLGFGDWRFVTALITGFMAKESVVSTLIVLFGTSGALTAALTPLSAAALLVFILLYTPCVAAISAVRRELGGRWALAMLVGQCAVAYAAALVVRLAGLAMGWG